MAKKSGVKAAKAQKSDQPFRVGEPNKWREAKGDIVPRPTYDEGRLQLAKRSEDPIERLARIETITSRQAEAALRLRRDYDIGVNQARDHDGGGSGHGIGPTEVCVIAITEFKRAMRALKLEHRGVVMAVACQDMTIKDYAERVIGRSTNKAMMARLADALKAGLSHLADHYRLPSDLGKRSVQVGGARVVLHFRLEKGGVRRAVLLGDLTVDFTARDDDALDAAARRVWREQQPHLASAYA